MGAMLDVPIYKDEILVAQCGNILKIFHINQHQSITILGQRHQIKEKEGPSKTGN